MNLSIIIPIYKIEKYLRFCIDSVLKQSFKDYEIIIVDGGLKKQSQFIHENAKLLFLYDRNKTFNKK